MTDEAGEGVPTADGRMGAQPHAASDGVQARRQAKVVVGVLGAATLFAMLPFASGLIGGPVLYVAARPLHRLLAPRIGIRRSAAVCTVVALVLVIVPLALLVLTIAARIPDTIRGMEESEGFKRLVNMQIGTIDVGEHVRTAAADGLGWLSRKTPQWIGNLTRSTLNLVLALFGLYYLLAPTPSSWGWMRRLLPVPDATAETLRTRFHEVTTAVLLGVALTAALQGAVVGVGFALVGLPDPLLWGVLTACASVLPVLGSALVWLPGVAVLLLEQRVGAALVLLVIGAVVASNIDNVARMLVLKRVANIHPFVTLAGAFAGVNAFGLVGLLLGPLLLSLLVELVRAFDWDDGRAPPASA